MVFELAFGCMLENIADFSEQRSLPSQFGYATQRCDKGEIWLKWVAIVQCRDPNVKAATVVGAAFEIRFPFGPIDLRICW